MTFPTLTFDRTRYLLDGEVVTADVKAPLYVHGQPYKADCRGFAIGIAKLVVSSMSGLSAVVVTLEDSEDGVTWNTWKAFASKAANGSEILDMASERAALRFIRCDINVTGTGTATLGVALAYCQVGARGEYADGVPDRSNTY